MEYTFLGDTGLKVSVIAFGCWVTGGHFWGGVNDDESTKAIKYAFDSGINFFDTANVYGFGHSEEVLGKALKDKRENCIIATKTGLKWNERGNISHDLSRKQILKSLEDSLKRLQTDYIDLYQLHWPDKDTHVEETALALEECKKSGKVRFAGCSNFSVRQMQEYEVYGRLNTLQPPYSILDREIEKDVLPYSKDTKTGVFVYSPLAKGLLTGKFTEKSVFGKKHARSFDANFKKEKFLKNLKIVKKLKPVAEKYGKTTGQLAIAWILANPAVHAAITGARTVLQIKENLNGAGWKISEEDYVKINGFSVMN